MCLWVCGPPAEYLGDASVPVGFDPSRINPHIIKNSFADRRLVLSGENAVCIWILKWEFNSKRDILKAKDLTGQMHKKRTSLNEAREGVSLCDLLYAYSVPYLSLSEEQFLSVSSFSLQ